MLINQIRVRYGRCYLVNISSSMSYQSLKLMIQLGYQNTKGYEANFMEELFKVVENLEGEPIIGKFYETELSGV